MPRKASPKKPAEAADHVHEPVAGMVMVRVRAADAISDGQGGYFPVDARIEVTPEQAASLKAQDLAS